MTPPPPHTCCSYTRLHQGGVSLSGVHCPPDWSWLKGWSPWCRADACALLLWRGSLSSKGALVSAVTPIRDGLGPTCCLITFRRKVRHIVERDCRTPLLARPNSQARTGTGKNSFSLFSWPRAGLATLPGWPLPLLYVMTIHTYLDNICSMIS